MVRQHETADPATLRPRCAAASDSPAKHAIGDGAKPPVQWKNSNLPAIYEI